jgi:hypothetical protein
MLSDKRFSISWSIWKVLALVCGLAGTAVVIYGAVIDRASIGLLGIPLVAAGAVLRIRSFFAAWCEKRTGAFDMGIVVGREQERETSVRSLR